MWSTVTPLSPPCFSCKQNGEWTYHHTCTCIIHAVSSCLSRLNHIGVCVSYTVTIKTSQIYTVPLQKWMADHVIFKFWGDKLDQRCGVHDVHSDHHGSMVHTYSMPVGRSSTTAIELPCTSQVADLASIPCSAFLPIACDIKAVKTNHLLTCYVHHLSSFYMSVP